jgi:hypothetical protein
VNHVGEVARVNAVVFLRRATALRAWKKFFAWVEKAFGWGMVAWLLFWLVVYLIAGFQLLIPLKTALPLEYLKMGALLSSSLFFAAFAISSPRLPTVIISSRDVMRLGIAPAVPIKVLEYPLLLAVGQQLFTGALFGGLLWVVLRAFFLLELPFAPPVLALLFASRVIWQMNLYAGGQRVFLVGLWLISVLLDVFLGLGISAALYSSSPMVLIIPGLMLITGWLTLQKSYCETFPSGFLQHSIVLAQLRAMGLMLLTKTVPPVGMRERLQRQLKVKTRRNSWRIPVPPVQYGASAALAWRNAQTMTGWSIGQWVFLLLGLAVFFATASSLVPNGFALPAQVLILSFVALPLVGSHLPNTLVPIRGSSILLGRIGIGASLIVISSLIATFWIPSAWLLGLRAIFCLVLLETLQRWTKNPTLTQNLGLAAALLTFAAEALLGFLGLASFESSVLIFLIFLIYTVQNLQE